MDDFDDDAICDDAAIADMNREYACRRSRENALDPDAGSLLSVWITVPTTGRGRYS